MVDHVAHLTRLDVATEAAEELVSPTCCLVYHESLREAHVAGVGSESVSDSALDDALLVGGVVVGSALRVRHRQLRGVVDRYFACGALSDEKVVLGTGSRHHLDWSVSHGLLLLLRRERRGHGRLNLHKMLLIVGS